ncbi:ribosomal-protein-alanine N-acetyltransferase [Mucilaginibacter gracilis]|uniref:Ribosomal-protein-alanine N-acetyltransferase n=1 Tax=Mucilaginibacter gracilis TaxID=423350 RepID=A0A495J0M2_9SPHI|nr:GNAT family N-acetyltransferase [Mucilaginibacter gracilis]RKR82525.1 ribosomal-protein-alanine N-acetyltransferase [Mucilaginibacter gracilis]
MLNLKFSTFPQLTTQRLILRQLRPTDAPQIHELRANPEVNRYIDRPASTGVADALAFIQKIITLTQNGHSFYWAITLKSEDLLIGTLCFWNIDEANQSIELGYELLPDYQGKGIITEAITEVLQFGFTQVGAKAIMAFPSANNARSVAVLQKLGFELSDGSYDNSHDGVDNMLTYILTLEKAGLKNPTKT